MNPYQAPRSMLAPDTVPDAELRQRFLRSMRSTSHLAIWTGLVLAVGALVAPHLLAWQAGTMLREFGAEQYLATMVEAHIAPLRADFIMLALLSAVAMGAGAMIRRLHWKALYLLIAAFALLIAAAVWGLPSGPESASVFCAIRAAWLVFVFYRAWQICRLAAAFRKRESLSGSHP